MVFDVCLSFGHDNSMICDKTPCMFAVIILATGSNLEPNRQLGRHLAATASACVAAVAEGLVGHGVVVAQADDRASQRLAEAIGADLAIQTSDRMADIITAARAARGEWLFILEAGDLPQEGWIGAVERHALATDRPALIPAFGFHGMKERFAAMIGQARPGPGWAMRRSDLLTWGMSSAGTSASSVRRPLLLPLHRTRISG